MPRTPLRTLVASLSLLSLLAVPPAGHPISDDIELPQLGEPADAVMSPREEYQIGARVTAQIHAAGYALEDPQLTDYISRLGWHIASHGSRVPDHLQFFMVRDPRINAFALPGGFMGFNAGLMMAAESESELAAVVAHELAHVTQRHIARTIQGTRAADIATWAAVLAAIIAGSASPDVVLGALSLGQAASLQRQVSFTRTHELEADRIGIGTMIAAGYDPQGMVSFFRRLEQQSRLYGSQIPDILRTHPVNTTRIAEARQRADGHSGRADEIRPLTFSIMRARSRVLTVDRPSQALDYFKQRIESGIDQPAEWYGAALAHHALGQFQASDAILERLLEETPRQIHFLLLKAENARGRRAPEEALSTLAVVLEQQPRYAPARFAYAETLMDAGRPEQARQFILDDFEHVRPFTETHRILARAARASGDRAELAYQSATYAWRRGDAETAMEKLDAGLRHSGLSEDERARLQSFRREVRETLPRYWRPQYEETSDNWRPQN
ncbi:MAG: M48 family metalloprotease [Algiphilus sp.]|uniref:M48 family metalloprotease n=1 Tax=Algiphilus sp. TaxID=1872431 RepID=UPI0032F01932|nr:M48 family metalloprotease [Algiphilus sp.]